MASKSMAQQVSTIKAQILKAATKFYIESRDFNGLPIRDIPGDDSSVRAALRELIGDGVIFVVSGDRHPNPHIQALEPESFEKQLKNLEGDLTHACVYPTRKHLATVLKPQDYVGRPYTRALALGEPQLSFRFFELRVLEHYRNDPRYTYDTDDIQGSISIRDSFYQSSDVAEKDKVLLQQFGFGYDRSVTTRVAPCANNH